MRIDLQDFADEREGSAGRMRPEFPAPCYRARVVRVIDGDTLECEVDLGLRCSRTAYVRLLDVDTPELRSGDPDEREQARAAKAYVQSLVLDRWVLMRTEKGKSFDRWLANVDYQTDDGWRDLGLTLREAGYHTEAEE